MMQPGDVRPRRVVAAAALILALSATPHSTRVFAAQPSPAPQSAAPVPGAWPSIAPAPIQSTLPEIGRTKTSPLQCSLLRELVAPSLGAAMDADAAFGNARRQLVAYGVLMGGRRPNGAAQTMGLMRLGRNVTAMSKDVLTIKRALGDPRISTSQTDADAVALRAALQELYAAENAKLNALSGYVEGEYFDQLLNDDESIAHLRATTANAAPHAATVLPTPARFDGVNRVPLPLPPAGQSPDAQLFTPPPAGGHGRGESDPTAALESKASRAIAFASAACR